MLRNRGRAKDALDWFSREIDFWHSTQDDASNGFTTEGNDYQLARRQG